MRRAAKVDANHARIVAVLKACGCQVLDMSKLGGGAPDLCVYSPGRNRIYMVEVKNTSRWPSDGKLTPAQVEFHSLWPVWIIESESEAIALAGGRVTA